MSWLWVWFVPESTEVREHWELEVKWNGLEILEPTGPTTSLPEAVIGCNTARSPTGEEVSAFVCRTVTLGETGTFLELCLLCTTQARTELTFSAQDFFPVLVTDSAPATQWAHTWARLGRSDKLLPPWSQKRIHPSGTGVQQECVWPAQRACYEARKLGWGWGVIEGEGQDRKSRCIGSLSHLLMNLT